MIDYKTVVFLVHHMNVSGLPLWKQTVAFTCHISLSQGQHDRKKREKETVLQSKNMTTTKISKRKPSTMYKLYCCCCWYRFSNKNTLLNPIWSNERCNFENFTVLTMCYHKLPIQLWVVKTMEFSILGMPTKTHAKDTSVFLFVTNSYQCTGLHKWNGTSSRNWRIVRLASCDRWKAPLSNNTTKFSIITLVLLLLMFFLVSDFCLQNVYVDMNGHFFNKKNLYI